MAAATRISLSTLLDSDLPCMPVFFPRARWNLKPFNFKLKFKIASTPKNFKLN